MHRPQSAYRVKDHEWIKFVSWHLCEGSLCYFILDLVWFVRLYRSQWTENFVGYRLFIDYFTLSKLDSLAPGAWPLWEKSYVVGVIGLLLAWGPFLESPGNFSGPKSNIQIEILRTRARVLAGKLLHFVSLTDSFIMLDAKLLKPLSCM